VVPPGDGPPAGPIFYPDATESAKATIIEIGEGIEAAKIDIVLGSVIQGYSVNGRVIDWRVWPSP
jgi:hypothetical protein